jgi:coenzyme PQQ precursor peptide PqqA
MRWTTPDFEEVCLNSEVTAYVNTDQAPAREAARAQAEAGAREQEARSPANSQ